MLADEPAGRPPPGDAPCPALVDDRDAGPGRTDRRRIEMLARGERRRDGRPIRHADELLEDHERWLEQGERPRTRSRQPGGWRDPLRGLDLLGSLADLRARGHGRREEPDVEAACQRHRCHPARERDQLPGRHGDPRLLERLPGRGHEVRERRPRIHRPDEPGGGVRTGQPGRQWVPLHGVIGIDTAPGKDVDPGREGHRCRPARQQDLGTVRTRPDEDHRGGRSRDPRRRPRRLSLGPCHRQRIAQTASCNSRNWSASASPSVTGSRQAKFRQT